MASGPTPGHRGGCRVSLTASLEGGAQTHSGASSHLAQPPPQNPRSDIFHLKGEARQRGEGSGRKPRQVRGRQRLQVAGRWFWEKVKAKKEKGKIHPT